MITIINQRIDDDHLDSFWYDGIIAVAGGYELIANGEIRFNQDDEHGNHIGFYDGKARDGFVMPENDQELEKLYNSENGYNMINNNWFEVVDRNGESVGDICDDYDGAIAWLEELDEAETK